MSEETLENIGERVLIDLLRSIAGEKDVDHPGLHPGDDASMIRLGDILLAVSSDSIWADTHIPPSASPADAGWYLAAVNLSDLAAMGARPKGALLVLNVPANTKKAWMEEFMDGFTLCLAEYETPLVGGDTKEGPGTFSATVLGLCEEERCTPRSGAKPGDIVCVTGRLGGRAAAIKRENGSAALRVRPRIREGLLGAKKGVNAAIDISDGLALSLHYIAEESQVKLEISPEKILLAEGASLDDGLYKGGDFELLWTMAPENYDDLVVELKKLGCSLTDIGKVVEGEGVYQRTGNSFILLERKGYEHFTRG